MLVCFRPLPSLRCTVVAVARANKKDQLRLVATGLFCNQFKLCTRKYMYSLCTVQTKVSTVLQDECVCRRAGVGGASGGGGHVCACGRGNIGGGGHEHVGGEMVVVVMSCAGGGTLVGGDGRSGCEPCRRGDIDGGRWSQWSQVMREGRHWWGEMVVVVASMWEGRRWWGEMVVVVVSEHARPRCRPLRCHCRSHSCPLCHLVVAPPRCHCCCRHHLRCGIGRGCCVYAGQGGGGGVTIIVVMSLVVSVPLMVPCCCCCCPPPPPHCLVVIVVSTQGRVVVVESPSSSCPSPLWSPIIIILPLPLIVVDVFAVGIVSSSWHWPCPVVLSPLSSPCVVCMQEGEHGW